jgi:hypothetical protein
LTISCFLGLRSQCGSERSFDKLQSRVLDLEKEGSAGGVLQVLSYTAVLHTRELCARAAAKKQQKRHGIAVCGFI